MSYHRVCGRLALTVSSEGAKQPTYGYGATVECRQGWNDDSRATQLIMSVEELHDLRHLIDRAIASSC